MNGKVVFLIFLFGSILSGAIWIMSDLQNRSANTFFGTAETDSRIINLEFPVVVQQLRVQPGVQVRQGDTLAVMYRAQFDRETSERDGEISEFSTELEAKNSAIDKELDILHAKQQARISELQAEIKVLKTETDIQSGLKAVLSKDKKEPSKDIPNVKKEQIAALEESIRQAERQTQEQVKQLENQRASNRAIYGSKVSQIKRSVGFIESDRQKLVVLAPIDGFVEQVFVGRNEMVQQYRELFKINAPKPVNVLCYLHETESEVMVQPGDTVHLISTARPSVTCPGVITGSTRKLVELPTRLRKFIDIKAWGREMYIQLPDTNRFYIGEKIQVDVKTPTTTKPGAVK